MSLDPSILHALLSPDGAQRGAAEAAYEQAKAASPEAVASGLLACLPVGAQPDGVRIMAAVLLRQFVDNKRPQWAAMSPQGRTATRTALLQLVFAEPQPVISHRIAHCVAQAAASEAWPELLQTVCGTIGQGGVPAQTALFVLEKLPDYAPAMMSGNAMALLPVYSAALASEDLKIRINGLKATGALLLALDSDAERAPFMPLVQPTLAALSAALQGGHESEAQEVLTALVDVAQNAVDFFRADLPAVVDAMLQVSTAPALDFDTRTRALELLVTLCQQSPARVRRCPSVLRLVEVCFGFMCAIEDDEDEDEEWVSGAYSSENYVDEEEDYMVGDEALENVLEALGKGLLPNVLGLVQPNAQHANWRHRRAALSVVGVAASGSTKAVKPHLPQAVAALAAGMADPHPRVKFAAINGAACLADLFAGEFQKAHLASVLPPLCALISDPSQCARVRGHACSCVINLVHPKYCEPEHVEDFSEALLGALCTCFAAGVAPEVMEEALGAVTCVAQVTEADFTRFYPTFMPGILSILEQGGGGATAGAGAAAAGGSRLRGKALQCVGMIGSAVGLEVFKDDAVKVLQLLMPAMQIAPGASSFPDGYFDYLAPACAQIAKALKEHFVQFLPTVVPPLLHTLGVEVECSVTEMAAGQEGATAGVSHDEETGMQSTVVEVRGRGAMKITMNTTAVMEKQQAAKTLYEYVDSLGALMLDFVEPSAHALLPLIVFKYSEDVRNSASFAVGKLFGSACDVVRNGTRPVEFALQFLGPFVQTLAAGLKGELHPEPRTCMAEALRDVLQACFESGGKDEATGIQRPPLVALSGAECASTCQIVLEVATASLGRRSEKMAAFSASDELEEEDQERLEEELEEEDELMTNLVDCVGYMLKALAQSPSGGPASTVALFDSMVVPLFGQFLGADQPTSLRHNAVCLFDDMIEFGGEAAHKYLPSFLPVLVEGLDSEEAFLQQASVYGIMQVAKHAPQHFTGVHAAVTPKLIALVQRPKDDENELVGENCVSALGTIASVAFTGEPQAQLLHLWLANLPLTADEVEAKVVHRQLCDLVEQGHPAIVGSGFEKLPALLGVFGHLLEAAEDDEPGCPEALVDASTRDRIVAITKQIQQQVPAPQVQSAWAALTAEQQGAVQRALA